MIDEGPESHKWAGARGKASSLEAQRLRREGMIFWRMLISVQSIQDTEMLQIKVRAIHILI